MADESQHSPPEIENSREFTQKLLETRLGQSDLSLWPEVAIFMD